MIAGAGTGAAREILVVLVLALAGLLLALLAAFTPWYARPVDSGSAVVVELHAPPGPVVHASLAAIAN